jgi:hypothetical protein
VVALPDLTAKAVQRNTSAACPRRRYTEPNLASRRNHNGIILTLIISSLSIAFGDCGRKPIAVNANTQRIGSPTLSWAELTRMTS